MQIENWAYPFESLEPRNDGAKADAAESIERKRIPDFMVVYDDFMDIIIDWYYGNTNCSCQPGTRDYYYYFLSSKQSRSRLVVCVLFYQTSADVDDTWDFQKDSEVMGGAGNSIWILNFTRST